jgi:hypothetical protein
VGRYGVTLSAPTVAAVLRRAGLVPASITREGIHVTANGPDEVAVETDQGAAGSGEALHDKALNAVRAAGYPVRIPSGETSIFYVTRRP